MKALLGLAAILAASPAMAMLSGFYDSGEKIETILASRDVADALRQGPIRAISNVGTTPEGFDIWQIQTQECDLNVHVIGIADDDEAPDSAGMVIYRVELAGSCD